MFHYYKPTLYQWKRTYSDVGDPNLGDPDSDPDPVPTPDPVSTPDPDPEPIIDPDPKKTFTQEELNTIMKREKAKMLKRNDDLIGQLESLKKNQSLSEKERSELENQIEHLKTEHMTEKQKIDREKQKMKKDYDTQLETIVNERDSWQNRYSHEKIQRALQDAAIENETLPQAVTQIVDMLTPKTRLIEGRDAEGNADGNFVPKVKFKDIDKDGNEIESDLTVSDVVKRMKEIPDRFGNLFKSTATGGLGSTAGVDGSGGTVDYKNMTPAQYEEHRKKLKKEGKL